MGRRTVLLVAALIAAVLGVVLVFLYAQNATETAQQGQTLVKVIVAKTQIEQGTTGSAAAAAGAFAEAEVPQTTVVNGAIPDASQIADLVALSTIFPGQQVIAQQWGAVDQLSRLPLPKGKIALSLQLGDPERVAGFVEPGSTVAIFATGGPAVRTLLSGITVIGVGGTGLNAAPAGDQQQQASAAILTLAVTQAEAEKIIYAQGLVADATYNGLYFALMDDNSDVTAPDAGVSGTNLFR